jgi:hypothetical protein
MSIAEVRIVFASGHVETFDIEMELPEGYSSEQIQDDIITLTKSHAGHGDGNRCIDTMWALISNKPLSSYCVNTKNVDFVSIKVK